MRRYILASEEQGLAWNLFIGERRLREHAFELLDARERDRQLRVDVRASGGSKLRAMLFQGTERPVVKLPVPHQQILQIGWWDLSTGPGRR
jgi:hypothetical protein